MYISLCQEFLVHYGQKNLIALVGMKVDGFMTALTVDHYSTSDKSKSLIHNSHSPHVIIII